jgi:hypothetical protein
MQVPDWIIDSQLGFNMVLAWLWKLIDFPDITLASVGYFRIGGDPPEIQPLQEPLRSCFKRGVENRSAATAFLYNRTLRISAMAVRKAFANHAFYLIENQRQTCMKRAVPKPKGL